MIVLGLALHARGQGGQVVPPLNPAGANAGTGVIVGPYGYGNIAAVGGISIQPDGLIENAGRDVEGQLSQQWKRTLQNAAVDFQTAAPLRKISLRRLEAAIRHSLDARKPLSAETLVLGGLQQVRYVFAYPQEKDIVLVGPAEGWKVDGHGNVVGLNTGRPVMLLDDLLVALRTAGTTARGGITCSIDPTAEGRRQLQALVATLRTIGNPEATAAAIERALGRQQVSFTGVPASSHFAGVLVAADYRMKRIAMHFEPSPVRGLPSYLSMLGGGGHGMSNMTPRWWLEPKYDAVLRDAAGQAWELNGGSARCMTEEEFLDAGGGRQRLGKASPLAQKWADLMTKHYGELAVAEPVFGELRNCMELAVVGAIVARIRAEEPAIYDMPLLMDAAQVETQRLPVASQVDSKASLLKKGRNWVISASGGVAIRSWEFVEKAETSEQAAAGRVTAAPPAAAAWSWH
jgi:hypothetical protein